MKLSSQNIIYFIRRFPRYFSCKVRLWKQITSNTLNHIISKENSIIISWWKYESGNNWGDALNPILVEKMSKRNPVAYNELINLRNEEVYSVIGSILGAYHSKNLIVWGSGFIDSSIEFKVKPKKVCAVRGPLTRDLMIKQGIDCPEIYGDPALLYPLFYKPLKNAQYKLGIIPHYVDQKSPCISKFESNPNVLVIDILSTINEVVDNICKCEFIASSSLHGIIASDAYGIPSKWIKFSDNVVGEGFKFHDYFLSVGRINEEPVPVNENTTIEDIVLSHNDYEINIDLIKLVEACPFLDNEQKNNLKQKIMFDL